MEVILFHSDVHTELQKIYEPFIVFALWKLSVTQCYIYYHTPKLYYDY